MEGQHLGKRWVVFGEKGSVNKRLSENGNLEVYFSEKLAVWIMFKWLKIFYYGNLECYKKILKDVTEAGLYKHWCRGTRKALIKSVWGKKGYCKVILGSREQSRN